jgi:hypothetical protein
MHRALSTNCNSPAGPCQSQLASSHHTSICLTAAWMVESGSRGLPEANVQVTGPRHFLHLYSRTYIYSWGIQAAFHKESPPARRKSCGRVSPLDLSRPAAWATATDDSGPLPSSCHIGSMTTSTVPSGLTRMVTFCFMAAV